MARLTQDETRALEAFVRTFPALRLALQARDLLNWLTSALISGLKFGATKVWLTLEWLTRSLYNQLAAAAHLVPNQRHSAYTRLGNKTIASTSKQQQHFKQLLPHSRDPIKRLASHQGGLVLGLVLYAFVYYVLIRHPLSNYVAISVAGILLVPYLLVVDNSHNLRSILMLSLPIMFTNRGRALIYCSMLAIILAGPMPNIQWNTKEIQLSLNCCKQFLVVKTDKFVDKNVVQNLAKLEDIVNKLVDDIKEFANKLKQELRIIIELALTVERFLANAIETLKRIVNICNSQTESTYTNCTKTFELAYEDCRYRLGSSFDFLCQIVQPLIETCSLVRLPDLLCLIPRAVVSYLDKTIGQRLRQWILVIENELYVDIDIKHEYKFNGTKSKSYRRVVGQIRTDMADKFWYVHLLARLFNLLSLVLVGWILITATYYHMHYLTDVKYDNMYIDGYLRDLDNLRATKIEARQPTQVLSEDSVEADDDDDDDRSRLETARQFRAQVERDALLFPMPSLLKQRYLGPFSLRLNQEEKHKLCVSTIVWTVVMCYVSFFVLMDFGLFTLIHEITKLIRQILFDGDLPIVKIESQQVDSGQVRRYNRTYLSHLRDTRKLERQKMLLNDHEHGNVGLEARYRRLMDSIEGRIPEDVDILDSLEQCLPQAKSPNFGSYKKLLYLSLITLVVVLLETYAMRTRHCIANLYFPRQAKKRALWLYQKLLAERTKFDDQAQVETETTTTTNDNNRAKLVQVGLKLVAQNVKR